VNLNIRRLAKWVAVLVAIPIAAIAGIEVVEYRAEMHARAFCERFPIGTSMQDVTKAAASEGDPRLRVLRSDHIAIGYTGITPSSRHLCLIEGDAGKVTLTSYGYMD
jgi:hypothetical protein